MKHLIKWLTALACFVLVLCVLPMAANAADVNGDGYDDEQVAAINALIASSDLKDSYAADDPANWDFILWTYTGEVYVLNLEEVTFDQPDTELDMSVFPMLESLNFCNTNAVAVDVTQNPELTSLMCEQSGVTELDISHNPLLERVFCQYTGITELDISHNPLLEELRCHDTAVTEIDLSNNPHMKILMCEYTGITSLDVSYCPDLWLLDAEGTEITALDVSDNPLLEKLDCGETGITTLDISNNPKLRELNCSYTGLTELDLSNQSELEDLDIAYSGISTLDLSNQSKLEDLDISYTGISTLDLTLMSKLEFLGFACTPITDLDFTGLENLEEVVWGGRGLHTITLPNGKTLTMDNNGLGIVEIITYISLEDGSCEIWLFGIPDDGYVTEEWICVPEEEQYEELIFMTALDNAEITCVFGLEPITALESITIPGVTLSPAFDPDVLDYTAEVENDVTSIDIGAEALNPETVEVTGCGKMDLAEGENVFTVTVTYDEDIQREYVITITRKAAAPVTPTPTPTPDGAPKTGDSTMLFVPVMLCSVSLLAVCALGYFARKKENG